MKNETRNESVVGANLRRILQKKGWTIAKLADKTGYSRGSLSMLINGLVVNPRQETVVKFAEALDVSVMELLNPTGDNTMRDTFYQASIPLVTLNRESVDAFFSGPTDAQPREWIPNIPTLKYRSSELVAIVNEGAAMKPLIGDGDIVYVAPLADEHELDLAPKDGDIVLAYAKGIETPLVRKLLKSGLGDYLTATDTTIPGCEKPLEIEQVLGTVLARYSVFR